MPTCSSKQPAPRTGRSRFARRRAGKTIFTGQTHLAASPDTISSPPAFTSAERGTRRISSNSGAIRSYPPAIAALLECEISRSQCPRRKERRPAGSGSTGNATGLIIAGIQGKATKGTTLVVWLDGKTADHRIDHNYFGPRPALGQNGGETIPRRRRRNIDATLPHGRGSELLSSECDGEAEIGLQQIAAGTFTGAIPSGAAPVP